MTKEPFDIRTLADRPYWPASAGSLLADARVDGAVIYGPSRSLRGRLANRVRRLLRLEERDEILGYYYGDAIQGGESFTIKWDARGIVTFPED